VFITQRLPIVTQEEKALFFSPVWSDLWAFEGTKWCFVLGVISKDVADNLSNRLCNTKSLLNKTAAYPELTWRGWNMSRCAALKKLGLCLCCGISNVERPRVRLTYVCVCVGSFLPLYVSWQCPGLPHRLSDHRKDMGGRSQAYRCTQRKRKVMCAQHRRSVLRMWAARYVLHVSVWFRSVYFIKVCASSCSLWHICGPIIWDW